MDLVEPLVSLDIYALENALCAYVVSWNAQHNDNLVVDRFKRRDTETECLRIPLEAFESARPGLALLPYCRSLSSECTYFPTSLSERGYYGNVANNFCLVFTVVTGYVYIAIDNVCIVAVKTVDSAVPVISSVHKILGALDTFNSGAMDYYSASKALTAEFNSVWNSLNDDVTLPVTAKALHKILSADVRFIEWNILRNDDKLTVCKTDRTTYGAVIEFKLRVDCAGCFRIVLDFNNSLSAKGILIDLQHAALIVSSVLTTADQFEHDISVMSLPSAFIKYKGELHKLAESHGLSAALDNCCPCVQMGSAE